MSNKTRRADAAKKNKRRFDHEARQYTRKVLADFNKPVLRREWPADHLGRPLNDPTGLKGRLRDKAEHERALNNLFPGRGRRRRKKAL